MAKEKTGFQDIFYKVATFKIFLFSSPFLPSSRPPISIFSLTLRSSTSVLCMYKHITHGKKASIPEPAAKNQHVLMVFALMLHNCHLDIFAKGKTLTSSDLLIHTFQVKYWGKALFKIFSHFFLEFWDSNIQWRACRWGKLSGIGKCLRGVTT